MGVSRGKVERGERPEDALARELLEELNLDIDLDSIEKYSEINHHYPDKAVHLEFWQIYSFAGEPMGVEGQELSWVEPRGLLGYDFPRANQKVVRRLVSSGY